MTTLDNLSRITKLVMEIDLDLIDHENETVQALIESMVMFWKLGVLNGASVIGLIGQAYAAGRARGRKKSAMREMVEAMEVEDGTGGG